MGFDTSNPLSNMLGTPILVIAGLAGTLLLALAARLCFSTVTLKKYVMKIKNIVVWNAIIRYWLEDYITISIASLIKLYALDFTNWYESIMSSSALASIVAVGATPFIIWIFLYKKFEEVSTPAFNQKYGSLTNGLNFNEKEPMLYHVAFTFRRLVLAILIVVIPHYSWLQTQLIIFICSLEIIFIGSIRPFLLPFVNNLELVNEVCVLGNTYFLIIYSDFVPEPEIRYGIGWVNISLLVLMILINLSVIIIKQIVNGKHWCKIRKLKKQYRRDMAYRETQQRLQLLSNISTQTPLRTEETNDEGHQD